MKVKNKKEAFICQITENSLKLVKYLINAKREFIGLGVEALPNDADDKSLTEKLNQALKRLGYNNNPLVISLPRKHATCRYLKIPAAAPQEIERIINLQASRYLPYSATELITAYQAISTDKDGYSDINLVIVHKDVIERYLKIFRQLKIKDFKIVLSSFGLCNLYSYLEPGLEPVMLIDLDFPQVELAINSADKLLFSRSFKMNGQEENWQRLITEEINRTKDAYLKDIQNKEPVKILLFGATKFTQKLKEGIDGKIAMPVEISPYWEKLPAAENFKRDILNTDCSLASLIGLGIKDVPESLNLLPQEVKITSHRISRRKEFSKTALLIGGIVFIAGLGLAKNLDNKALYVKQLKLELKKIEKDAKPLEELEKRFSFMSKQLQKKPSALDLLYELHQSTPGQITLVNFSYEEDGQIILRGQTPELNQVFSFVAKLEKSPVFKNFNIKVRYATKKKTGSGEIVDFEIVCAKTK